MSVTGIAKKAKTGALTLAGAGSAEKNIVLAAMADALLANSAQILEANAKDVARAREAQIGAALIDRLSLNPQRLAQMAEGLRELQKLHDPIGEVVCGWTLENGVKVRQVRVPMGIIGIIYEARPNVTADAAGICLKAGSAVLLKGSGSASDSNSAIVQALREGIGVAGTSISDECVQLVPGGRESTVELMQARGLIDLLIPRGGAGLIQAVVAGAKVPVIETGTGNCHLYVHRAADFEKALRILINAKTQRPSVCNAVETLLIDRAVLTEFFPQAVSALIREGVTLHCDRETFALAQAVLNDPVPGGHGTAVADLNTDNDGFGQIVAATAGEYDGEYLSLDLAVKTVANIESAIEHIRIHSTGHSETIITEDCGAANEFTEKVDAAAVLVNTSSRFIDGGQFGFGAEIGISTQKMHARGPMGLKEMTATKYILFGEGQIRN